MTDLGHILYKMPDDWGHAFKPAIHPSSCRVPHDPRIFMFATRLGWVKPFFSDALRIGDIFHAYMENYYAYPDSDPNGLVEKIATAAEMEIVERQEELAKAGEEPPSGDQERKAIGMGIMLGQVFTELFPLKSYQSSVAVEEAFKMSLSGVHDDLSGRLVGKIDAVIYDSERNEYWLVDHKSTSEDPAVRARGLLFDTQAKLYRLLWDTAYPRKKLTGVVHNIIQKPTIKLKKNESFDEYIKRCFEWYDDKALVGTSKVRQSWVRFPSKPVTQDQELIELLRNVCPWYTCRLSLEKFYRTGHHHDYVSFGRLTPYMDLLEMHPQGWYDYLVTHGFKKIHPDSRYEVEEK